MAKEKVVFKEKHHIKDTPGDKAMYIFTDVMLILVLLIIGVPLIYVISSSLSSTTAIQTGQVFLWPIDFTPAGYKWAFSYKPIWVGYYNTIIYTVGGVTLNMILTVLCAYPLSKKDFPLGGVYMKILFVSMYVSAGLIPNFLWKSKLGLVNSRWSVILAGALSVHNMIIVRTAFKTSIPGELFEAAKIDGASDIQCLLKIALPLAKATLSVVTLYYTIGSWNAYFTAMIYIKDSNKFPLALIMRNLLISQQLSGSEMDKEVIVEGRQQMEYASIVISTIPVLVMYLWAQKYFEKGVMIGSVKG